MSELKINPRLMALIKVVGNMMNTESDTINTYANTESSTSDSHVDLSTLDAEKLGDIKDLADSRETSSSVSPCPSEHEADERIVVRFKQNDKSSPYNWPRPKKLYVVFTCMFLVLNSTLGSTIAAGTAAPVQKYFDVYQ